MIFARKINKIIQFYMIFGRKMPEFYVKIDRKILGDMCPLPPAPTPMAASLAHCCQRAEVLYRIRRHDPLKNLVECGINKCNVFFILYSIADSSA